MGASGFPVGHLRLKPLRGLVVKALAAGGPPAVPPALVGDDTFISVLACDLPGATFETNEPVSVDAVTMTLSFQVSRSRPAPGVLTVDPGSLVVSLDPPLEIYQWLRLDVDVTGQTSGLSTTLTVFLAHTPLDVNGDGRTNISDATAFGMEFNGGADPGRIDINCDGSVNVQDATAFGNLFFDVTGSTLDEADKP